LLFLIGIGLLGLDDQWVLALPQWLWLKAKELLSSFFVYKLNKHRALEQLFLSTAKANGIGWAIGGEKSLNVKLRARLLITEAFDINGSSLCLGSRSKRVIGILSIDFLLAFWTSDFKEMAFFECGHNSRDWLESFHAAKLADLAN